jgi:hypothetical protein
VAGGVLVTCAMLGVLVAPGGAEEARRQYLVTTIDLAPGEQLDPTTLQPLSMDLPPTVARHALTAVSDGDGLTARVAVPAGSVLHADQLRETPTDVTPGPEVTIAVPVRRALGGELAVGDVLDVIATYGSGTEGFSQLIAAGVIVTRIVPAEDTLGVEPGVTVTIRLAQEGDVLPVVHASHADALSLVLDADGGTEGTDSVFRPTPPESESLA